MDFQQVENSETDDPFYKDAIAYWSEIPPTVDGMLGGFEYITETDLKGSTKFIKQLMKAKGVGNTRALDCGAGIGRVSKGLLLPLFKTIDMLEVTKKFLDEAPRYIGEQNIRVGHYICCGMQDFIPEEKYDVIWCQWVIGHLTDKHLIAFYQRCKAALNENGVICIKDNCSSSDKQFDTEDSSMTRSLIQHKELIQKAGLSIIQERLQEGFPVGIYAVPMIAFR